MKQKKIYFLIVLCAVFFAYITNIDKIPNEITLFQNEKYQIEYLKGLEIEGNTLSKDQNIFKKLATINTDIIGNIELKLSTLGGLFNKKITVNVIPKTEVIPGGDLVGIKLYSKGVIIVGDTKIQSTDGTWHKIYDDNTFKAGDILLKLNDYEIESAEEVSRIVNNIGEQEILITYERDGKELTASVTPIRSFDDRLYKIGLWIRDGAMGVGTTTFYYPETSSYGALGHGISDEDSKELITIEEGEIHSAKLISVEKGKSEKPGEIKGFMDESLQYGTINQNVSNGIYGFFSGDYEINSRQRIEVASKNEIRLGKAKIRCTVDESQEIKEYDVEIIKIFSVNFLGAKGMIIKVTDKELLRKTGGIIQGMSGSPIIQNGKLVGAVTHVYLNDPTRGYATFAETMISNVVN